MRILVAEDNNKLAQGVRHLLNGHGYSVDVVGDGEAVLAAAEAVSYDLLVLDLGLPVIDGLEVLKTIRGRRLALPVLVLTARGSLDERVRGLDAGADDYLTKPFEWSELEARIRALIRRASAASNNQLEFGDLTIDLSSGAVSHAAEPLDIPAREAHVLQALMRSQGRMLSKSQLIESVSSFDDDLSINALEQYISRLRKRLSQFGISIQVARGLGYYLQADR